MCSSHGNSPSARIQAFAHDTSTESQLAKQVTRANPKVEKHAAQESKMVSV